MSAGAAIPADEEVELAGLLESLASPSRLALLRQLRSPRALGEIRVRAEQTREGMNPDRPMSRQAVRAHLDRLLAAGFARAREGRRGNTPTEEYLVNHQRLFALAEELRRLGELRPSDLTWEERTVDLPDKPDAAKSEGPRLVLVHGLGEGRVFRLAGASEWTIGRRWGLPVSLDYDPYVSSEHARIARDGDRFFVEALPTSRNPVLVEWEPVPAGSKRELRHGDVVGVGKSLLLFRT